MARTGSAGQLRASASAALLDQFVAAHALAAERTGLVEHDLVVADRRVRLAFAGETLVPDIIPALRARIEPPQGHPDATIRIFDSATSAVLPPRFPWRATDVVERGAVRGWDGDEVGVVFHGDLMDLAHDFRAVSLYGHATGEGCFWLLDRARTPWWERAAPLRSLLHWALRTPDRLLVHAAAIGVEGHGVLLTGPSGSGKSTTALAAVSSGLEYAGDDYVLVDIASPPIAYNVYSYAKLKPDTLGRWPALRGLPVMTDDAAAKVVIDLAADAARRIVARLTVRGIVVPRVVEGGRTELTRTTAQHALLALAPSTVFQLPPDGGRALRPLARLAASVPTWRLDLGGEPESVVDLLRELTVGARA